MSIAINAETGQPLYRDLTDQEIEAQAEWKEEMDRRRAAMNHLHANDHHSVKRQSTIEREEKERVFGNWKPNGFCSCGLLLPASGICCD